MTSNKPFVERFMDKVSPEPNSGCWLWTGCCISSGYGQISLGGKVRYAHRTYYELVKGPIAKGLYLDHKCRVRCCVNPDHLEVVTNRENVLRGIGQSAQNARKTHCIRGHPFSTENTYIPPHKPRGRECRACREILERRRPKRIRP